MYAAESCHHAACGENSVRSRSLWLSVSSMPDASASTVSADLSLLPEQVDRAGYAVLGGYLASSPPRLPKNGEPTTYAPLRRFLEGLRSIADPHRECPCCGVDPEPVAYALKCLDQAEANSEAVESIELRNGELLCGNISVEQRVMWDCGETSFVFDFSGELLYWYVSKVGKNGLVQVEPSGDVFRVLELDTGEEEVVVDWEKGVETVLERAEPKLIARNERLLWQAGRLP